VTSRGGTSSWDEYGFLDRGEGRCTCSAYFIWNFSYNWMSKFGTFCLAVIGGTE
jgi:hypothetical protein